MSREFDCLCETCLEPSNENEVEHVKENYYVDSHKCNSCKQCWEKHLKVRVDEFGDFKCISCSLNVSDSFLIKTLRIDAHLVSSWKKNGMEQFKNRKESIKRHFGKSFACKEPNCKEATFLGDFDIEKYVFVRTICSTAVFFLVSMFFQWKSSGYDATKDDFNTAFMFFIFFMFVSLLFWIPLALLDQKRYKERLIAKCSAGHQHEMLITDEETLEMFKTTRPCPSCHARITKSAGCRSVICTQCKTAFCYSCCNTHWRCQCRVRNEERARAPFDD